MFLSTPVHLRVPVKHGGSVQGSLCCASVTAEHVHLYVLLLVGGRDAAHGRHQAGVAVPQYRPPSMFI
jgi:hypothetical protein